MAELQLDQASVLGSMILAPEIIGDVVTTLTPEDFGAGDPADLFRALRALYMEGGKIDVVTALDRMGRTPEHQSYLLSVMDATPTAANWREYVRIVREQARLRALQSAGLELASTGTTLETARDLVARLDRLMRDRREVECVDMEAGMLQFTDEQARQPHYLPWGLPWLDEGLTAEAGDYIVLGGYPSDGKTALALSLAYAQAETRRVGFFSLETSASKLFARLCASVARISSSHIKRRTLTDDECELLASKSDEIRARKLQFVRASSMTVEDIGAFARAKQYDVIYVDYLSLIQAQGRTEYDQVTAISKGLHRLAQDNKITVVALSQLSRPEQGKPKIPTLASLRSSGQVEQDADVVMLLYREEPDNIRSRRILHVAKNKEGVTGRVALLFDGETQRFRADSYQDIPSAAKPKTKPQEPEYKQAALYDLPGSTPVPWEHHGTGNQLGG